MYPSSNTSQAELILRVRGELGTAFDDQTVYPDARIANYLNEGQAWMLPDVSQKLAATLTFADAAVSVALPSAYVRMIDLWSTDGSPIPPYQELDGILRFTGDPTGVQGGAFAISYEAAFPLIDGTHPCLLPDPGNEGLVAFATWRVLERVVSSRDDFRRYATQTGSNVVTPSDLKELADLYQQRYAAVRDVLAQRVASAAATF
jgi:hypothetical protein